MDYWQAFIAVLWDLYQFMRGEARAGAVTAPLFVAALEVVKDSDSVTITTQPDKAPVPVLEPLVLAVPSSLGQDHVGWVAVPRSRLYMRPVHVLDTVLGELSYATKVTVLQHEGRFSFIACGTLRGWVLKDDIVMEESVVYPVLTSGVVYDAHHGVTTRIRQLLHDAFAAESLLLPLLSVEYITYILSRHDRAVPWPEVRPRPAGRWHELLRGVPGIEIGTVPRTGAVMEWGSEGLPGVLAYTESVAPDGTVQISSVGKDSEGKFLREVLVPGVYRELRPVWIQLT